MSTRFPVVRDQDHAPDVTLFVGSHNEMIEIMDQVASEFVDEGGLSGEGLGLLEVGDDGRARYFLRYDKYQPKVAGVVGKVGTVSFAKMVRKSINTILGQLDSVWSGDWVVCAYRIREGDITRLSRRRKENPAASMALQAVLARAEQDGDHVPTINRSARAKETVHTRDSVLYLDLAIAERSQRPLEDPLSMERPGNHGGVFYRFSQTQSVRDLPRTGRVSRKTAEEIIRHCYTHTESEPSKPSVVPGLRPLEGDVAEAAFGLLEAMDDAQIAAVLQVSEDQVAALRAEYTKG